MALPQARPPWLDTTMPRTPTATACGAAQGRTKIDGKRMEKGEKRRSSWFVFIFNLHLFHLHLFHPKCVFFLFFIFTWTKKIWKTHTTIPVLQPRDSEDLEKVLLWGISQLDYEGLFAASSTWLLEKWTAHTSTIFVSLTKKEASSTSKQIWKKLPPCSHVHPGGVSFSLRLQCILSTLNAFQVDRYICLIGIADSVRASFDVISPRMSFFGGGEGIEEKFYSPAMTSTKQFFNNKNSNCMFWFFFLKLRLCCMKCQSHNQPNQTSTITIQNLYCICPFLAQKRRWKTIQQLQLPKTFPLWVSAQKPEMFSSTPSALPSWSYDSGRHRSTAPWHGVRPRDAARWRPQWSPVLQHPGARRDPADRGWSHLRGCRLERQEGALDMTGLLLCVFFAAGRYLIAFLEGGCLRMALLSLRRLEVFWLVAWGKKGQSPMWAEVWRVIHSLTMLVECEDLRNLTKRRRDDSLTLADLTEIYSMKKKSSRTWSGDCRLWPSEAKKYPNLKPFSFEKKTHTSPLPNPGPTKNSSCIILYQKNAQMQTSRRLHPRNWVAFHTSSKGTLEMVGTKKRLFNRSAARISGGPVAGRCENSWEGSSEKCLIRMNLRNDSKILCQKLAVFLFQPNFFKTWKAIKYIPHQQNIIKNNFPNRFFSPQTNFGRNLHKNPHLNVTSRGTKVASPWGSTNLPLAKLLR